MSKEPKEGTLAHWHWEQGNTPGRKKTQYWIMDDRACYDIDKAIVLETCDTFEEAYASRYSYGTDSCIVQVTPDGKQELVWVSGVTR